MSCFEELCDEAFLNQIGIFNVEMSVPGMGAVYIRANGLTSIFMRRDATDTERTCWMAEELGHHHMGVECVLMYDTPEDWRAEARARRWAHSRILSPDSIRTAARNTDDIYEIADALCVTVDFLTEAISDYVTKGLWPSCPLAL
jgi:hypothetical protein